MKDQTKSNTSESRTIQEFKIRGKNIIIYCYLEKKFKVIDNKDYQILNYCLHFCGDVKLEGLLHVTSFIECRLRLSNKIPTTKDSMKHYFMTL